MLRNLYKHEFKALLRSYLPLWIAIFTLAILTRVTYEIGSSNNLSASIDSFADTATKVYSGFFITFSVCFLFGLFLLFLFCFGISIIRYYKNFFSGEGGFTFTVPISMGKQFFCKYLCAGAMFLSSVLIGFASVLVVSVNTPFISDLIVYVDATIEVVFKALKQVDFSLYKAEYIILFFLTFFTTTLQYYFALTFGHRFKHKIWGAVLWYIIVYLSLQLVLLLIFLVLFILIMNIRIPFTILTHILLISVICVETMLVFLFMYLITRRLRRKLDIR